MAKVLVGNLKYQDSVIELGQEIDELRDNTVPNTREVNDKPLSTDIDLNKTDLGLENVDNTADIDKPVSNATATALSKKADLVNGLVPPNQLPEIEVSKEAVGLGNVDNTSDLDKPISTETASELVKKADLVEGLVPLSQLPHIEVSKEAVGLGNADNTSDADKPVSNATSLILATKADLVDGLIPTSQIPAVSLTTSQIVANRAQLLALTNVQEGDIVVVSGTADKGTYMLGPNNPAIFSSWISFVSPTDLVTSVNGQLGPVVLGALDVEAVPLTRTIAGRPLTSDITLSPGDILKAWAGNNQRALVATGPPGTPYGEVAAGSTTSGVSVVMRDSNNRFTVADPAVDTDVTNKRASELTGDRSTSTSLGNVSGVVNLSGYIRSRTLRAVLTGNITSITLPTLTDSEALSIILVLTQDATGGRTIVWPTGLSSDGVKPVLSTSPNAKDLITLFWDGVSWWILQGARNGL